MLDKWEGVCVLGLAGAGCAVIAPGTLLVVTAQPSCVQRGSLCKSA